MRALRRAVWRGSGARAALGPGLTRRLFAQLAPIAAAAALLFIVDGLFYRLRHDNFAIVAKGRLDGYFRNGALLCWSRLSLVCFRGGHARL